MDRNKRLDWALPGRASVLLGGQFGSEGKGLAAAWLAHRALSLGRSIWVATTNAGAQAGHTTKYKDGSGFVCFHLPTTGVVANLPAFQDRGCVSYVNAGSIVDMDVLLKEIQDVNLHTSEPGQRSTVVLDPRAAVITDEHRAAEKASGSSTEKLASTQKGVGAAMSDKFMRRSPLVQGVLDTSALHNYRNRQYVKVIGGAERQFHSYIAVQRMDLNNGIGHFNQAVVVEIPQGMGLSINHGYQYPYVTSRDCWVGSGLSDAGIHPSLLGPVCMVVRTFPIRVGNLYNELGEEIGHSGRFYSDSAELDWARDFPGIEPERTTVTKRVRRIATWSPQQYRDAVRMNRPSIVFINFCNYLVNSSIFGVLSAQMRVIEMENGLFNVHHVYGFGPCVEDVTDSWDEAMAWYEHRDFNAV